MNAPVYEPTNLVGTVVALVFYLVMAGFIIYSIIGLYSLMRFGRSRTLTISVSILYLIISASLYAAAIGNLNAIK